MLRVVIDVNVFVAALLAPQGTSARVIQAWTDARFELVVSPLLLAELERVLRRPKFEHAVSETEICGLVEALHEEASNVADPPPEPGLTADPGDDYLVALARTSRANCIVSGDAHLTGLPDPRPPVFTPGEFVVEIR